MEWYWWVIIAAAIVGFVFLKVKVGGAWLRKRQEKRELREKQMEDD
jgi:hypothetical protein